LKESEMFEMVKLST